ncbi:hypothetical protein SNEBB_005443 [Seison nebaliae]|nr:hypothetical protein SNEBB_005443 [Seison nebaliae]
MFQYRSSENIPSPFLMEDLQEKFANEVLRRNEMAIARLEGGRKNFSEKNSNQNENNSSDSQTLLEKDDSDDVVRLKSELVKLELERKRSHRRMLNRELWFNEPKRGMDGIACKCSKDNRQFGIRHQIYRGENATKCEGEKNYFYKVLLSSKDDSALENFQGKKQNTQIKLGGKTFEFDSFIIKSEIVMDNFPPLQMMIFAFIYTIKLERVNEMDESIIRKSMSSSKLLFLWNKWLFHDVLNLFDFQFIFQDNSFLEIMPLFIDRYSRTILDSLQIVSHFYRMSLEPLFEEDEKPQSLTISTIAPTSCKQRRMENEMEEGEILSDDGEDDDYYKEIQRIRRKKKLRELNIPKGELIQFPGYLPGAIRLDQLDDEDIDDNSRHSSTMKHKEKYRNEHILFVHFSRRPSVLQLLKDPKYSKLSKELKKQKCIISQQQRRLTVNERLLISEKVDELNQLSQNRESNETVAVFHLPNQSFRTGIFPDLSIFSLFIPHVIEHCRYHKSLYELEKSLNYQFVDRSLLQLALTHSSGNQLFQSNLLPNSDHLFVTLNHIRSRSLRYGDERRLQRLVRKKGIPLLKHLVFSNGQSNRKHVPVTSNNGEKYSDIRNYERLEFLGDALLEFIVSCRLFRLFPMADEGVLSIYRTSLVQNQFLTKLSERLQIQDYLLFSHGPDLAPVQALHNATADVFEALLAAIYLDSKRLSVVEKVLGKVLWIDNEELEGIWLTNRKDPMQQQFPDGDRHLIEKHVNLKRVQLFEERIGVQFKHIRLLCRAFASQSIGENYLSLGNNQRLEFLGDTVMNFVISDYLYRNYPTHHEGHLSLLRSALVSNETQGDLYEELGMNNFVIRPSNSHQKLITPTEIKKTKERADIFEAVLGAIYIDRGLQPIHTLCNVCIFQRLSKFIGEERWNDPKSKLQQCCLASRSISGNKMKPVLPVYKLTNSEGTPSNKIFHMSVSFKGQLLAYGSARNKHQAQLDAAKNALIATNNMRNFSNKQQTKTILHSKISLMRINFRRDTFWKRLMIEIYENPFDNPRLSRSFSRSRTALESSKKIEKNGVLNCIANTIEDKTRCLVGLILLLSVIWPTSSSHYYRKIMNRLLRRLSLRRLKILRWGRNRKQVFHMIPSSLLDEPNGQLKNYHKIYFNMKNMLYHRLPLRLLSYYYGKLNHLQLPSYLRSFVYGIYINWFDVSEDDIGNPLHEYASMSEFFTRTLRSDCRLLAKKCDVCLPSDGCILSYGPCNNISIDQIKGVNYSMKHFIGPITWNVRGKGPTSNINHFYIPKPDLPYHQNLLHHESNTRLYFTTIYLSPGDYHRFHSPTEWTIHYRRHFPGELFSVNPSIARWINGLFVFNERVIYIGKWKYGFFSMTAVGATNVGSIKVYFDDELKTNKRKKWHPGEYWDKDFRQHFTYNSNSIDVIKSNGISCERNDSFGHFDFGSTVILIFEAPNNFRFNVTDGAKVRVGESLGSVRE